MTQLAVALIQILGSKTRRGDKKRRADILIEADRLLTKDPVAKKLFEGCYRTADRFMFTPDFLSTRTVTWLGAADVHHEKNAYARSDYFLVENEFHHTTSIHQHIAFLESVDLRAWDTQEWRSIIYPLHELYWSWDWAHDRRTDLSGAGGALDPFLRKVEPPAAAQYASRGFYISLYDADPGLISGWETVAPALVSLLNLQAEGIDQKNAAESLKGLVAQSTEFFVTFYNSDTMLSLSRPYPSPTVVKPYDSGYPTAPGAIGETQAALDDRLAQHGQRYEPYDLIPEYPVLRYLDLGLTEFTTNAKSRQWNIRHQLDALSQSSGISRVLRTATALPKIDRTYYRSTAVFILRLPVTRDLATKLIGDQGLDLNQRAIDGMKSSLLNTLVTILTVAAVLLGAIQLVLAFK
jgi:hypothetical protein